MGPKRVRDWERRRLSLLQGWAARHGGLQAASDDASLCGDSLCRSARLEGLAVRLWVALHGLGACYVVDGGSNDHWLDRRTGARFFGGRPRPDRRASGHSL